MSKDFQLPVYKKFELTNFFEVANLLDEYVN